MSYKSPRTPGSTPIHDYDSVYSRMSSATPTPSPRPTWADSTPRRPATRAAHSRFNSYSQASDFSPRPPKDSPRYNSIGQYSTADGATTAAIYDDYYTREQASAFQSPQPQPRPPTSFGHSRRSSTAVPPPRPQTVRPASSHRSKPASTPSTPKATDADARKHRIPAGYVKRAEETVGRVRTPDNRDLVEEFIEAGERLTEKLRSLLKACEAPMLKAAKRKQAGLGKNAGVEFVETLFGRDRELDKTEKFMQNVRLFNLRFDANCEEILRNPTK
ncbi:hypothetical protein FOXG_02976 [Fusarium oxysporum f. sp. lycopersici 4287]|uniref:Vegetative cell wall protein gp1 n=1 Tax=Fusarium oxysporum f. sp. lycopersici (strain 4287 / CBS 123668 / FGSC 9935 / NRRL 34936) TaxID=426428 RepID=A0A0J9UKI1_FUSO4|nr:hypothetical protein FOXG_02976 [Fusarium oxysporum f. sp. lycopersici 4287]XP_018236726.1 hypothetical protein FOXG_02976 [Fusarium oxysporum f. sp. lycopersici 4287]KNA98679.1 hypothetical protein FOXG_02976 [Fusarium oxysporum f. sp. lycopersici 4287]KNA98680.1 hypothetical protein FOXG_02976 [Fusarium oxysporum f. sp. lycopersici 4287]